MIQKILSLKASHPQNLAMRFFDVEYFHSLDSQQQNRLLHCVKSGLEIATSEMGCYASDAQDYRDFSPLFSQLIATHHHVNLHLQHRNSWIETTKPANLHQTFDVSEFSLPPLSLRARVARNIDGYSLPSAMQKYERIDLEDRLCETFKALIARSDFGGEYVSLTPGHSNFISEQQHQHLVSSHLMFRNMPDDDYLQASGIANNWPHGRGCYLSADRTVMIWVGEEDHLRIMCMRTSTHLNSVYDQLKITLDSLQEISGLIFSHSPQLGFLTSCPTNLGTAMRLSAHMRLAHLAGDGVDTRVREIAEPLALSVRGADGEHTAVGAGGLVDISPKQRFGCTEADTLSNLYQGIKALQEAEIRAAC